LSETTEDVNMREAAADEAWQRYGRALIAAMGEVLQETDDSHRELVLEVADFWLGLGLVAGLEHAEKAKKLLAIVESHAAERTELLHDAEDLLAEALP
jgi:hypothetical protein